MANAIELKGTHLSIKGLTAENVNQSKNLTMTLFKKKTAYAVSYVLKHVRGEVKRTACRAQRQNFDKTDLGKFRKNSAALKFHRSM